MSGSQHQAPRRRRRPVDPTAPDSRARRVRLLVGFVACVIVVNALVGEKGLLESMRAREEYQELAVAIGSLRAENARLREEARLLREDPGAIEALARRELGLIKPGELLFIVKDARSPAQAPAPLQEPSSGR